MQTEAELDDKWEILDERTDGGTSKSCIQEISIETLIKKEQEAITLQDLVLINENEELHLIKEVQVTCIEEITKSDRNSGALTELATGSLATCTSILEVGKDESSKLRGSCTVSSASKMRLCFPADKYQKMSTENRRCSTRLPNGSESLTEHNVCKDRHRPSSISKFVAQESKALSSKSSSCDSNKSPFQKLPATQEETSDFCKVYSQELRLGVSRDGSKSPKSSVPRRSVIELKSKSLDPPPSLEADILRDEAFHVFPVLRPTPSSLHPSSIKRRESETAVFSSAENAWLRRISDSHQARKTAKCDSLFDDVNAGPQLLYFEEHIFRPTPPTLKNLNIQKLRAFFGETTPRIMEAKSLTRHQSTSVAKDDSNIDSLKSEASDARTNVPCRCSSTSGTFDPTNWGFEKMSKSKKTMKNLSRSNQDPPNRSTKKSLRERDPSSSPKQHQKEHKTWKGKMVQTLRRYGSGATPSTSSEEYTGALGVPLEHCVSSFANEFVPLIVETCTRIVEEKGLESVGVYRVPGNSVAASALIEELNKDPEGLCLENEKWQDVNLVSSLLKLFFRKLPDSLITDDLYDAIIAANRIENAERRMLKMKKLIHELPEHNFETLRFLAQHLNRVASREEINKMDPHNLAIVFGPTLVRPQEDSIVVMVRDMTDQCKVIESIISHCDWYFSSWDEDVYVPVDGDDEDSMPISGMNVELLAKAERLDKRSSLSF